MRPKQQMSDKFITAAFDYNDLENTRQIFIDDAVMTNGHSDPYGYRYVTIYFRDGSMTVLDAEEWTRIRGW